MGNLQTTHAVSFIDLEPGMPELPRPRQAAPLLPVAIGLMVGIVADREWSIRPWMCLLPVMGGGGLVLVRRGSATLCFAGLVVASAGLGAARHAIADRRVPANHIVLCTRAEPMLAKVRGQVATLPRIVESPPERPAAFERGPRTRFILAARVVEGVDGPQGVTGSLAVTIHAAVLTLEPGEIVELTGWLYRPRPPANPGDYDWAGHLRREGVRASFSCEHVESVRRVQPAGGSTPVRLLAAARARLRGYLLADAFAEDADGAGIVAAMVLGERSAVSRGMEEAFLRTGNAHVLAASGMNVAWLGLVGWAAARLAGLYYRTTAVMIAGLIASYLLIAEPQPSILRAGIIGLVACLSAVVRGRYNSMNALAFAAVVLLLMRPSDLFTAGFQLSYAATLGLLHGWPEVSSLVARGLLAAGCPRAARYFSREPYALGLFQLEESGTFAAVAGRSALRGVAQLFSLAVCEWALTAPLSAFHFNTFTPWGWFGTFVLSFLAMPVTCLGYISVLAGLAFPSAGLLLGPLLREATGAMTACVDLLARLPASLVDGRWPSLAWVAVCYAVIAAWTFGGRWLGRRSWALLAAGLVAWWIAAPLVARQGEPVLRVWMLAVGDGTATVIELPDGSALLYDAGTRSALDAGEVVANILRRRGIDRIEAAFVSHPDFDHYSGIEPLSRRVSIARLIVNDHFERLAPPGSEAGLFLDRMRRRTIVEACEGPRRFGGSSGVEVESLWPPSVADRRALRENDASTVLRISWRGRALLLTGDIEEAGMAGLLDAGRLRADVLALPHHGAVTTHTGRFIRAVNPAVAVRSSGQSRSRTSNGIERLAAGARYFNTADVGCVEVEIRETGVTARGFRPG
jgi:competence protein ComEC